MTLADARKRNPEATRGAILEAAEKLFVASGFAATSMSDVAAQAGVTKSLIHHHFGSKEDLWNEVKRQRVSHYADLQRRLLDEEDDDEATLIRRSIEVFYGFLKENPEFVRLSSWMNLEDPRLGTMIYPELVTRGAARIVEDQRTGRIRDDIDPKHLVAMFVSMCMYWFMARQTGLASLRQGPGDDADRAYLEDLLKVLFHGVRPRP
jgi:TetR/AcrR family transcriptional regulator